MSYRSRLTFLVFLDSAIVLTSVYLSYWFLQPDLLEVFPMPLIVGAITLLCSHHLFFFRYKLYKKAWEYASVTELYYILRAVTFSIVMTAAVQLLVVWNLYIRILFISWMLHVLLISGSRFVWRVFRDAYITGAADKKRTLIVGAGSAGTMIVRQLLRNREADLQPIAFVDDDVKKQKLEIMNVPVSGTTSDIQVIVRELDIQHIIIAIPSLNRKQIHMILQECMKTRVKTKIVPMLEDLLDGKVSVSEMRDVQVEDLLGRETVQLDDQGIAGTLTGKTVLVTGAGGSIGSEICRQVLRFQPKKIVLLGHGENSIYNIEMELKCTYNDVEITAEIADVQDRNKMFDIMDKHRPYIVYHAAAHKHVPLMERNPEEAVKNNIFGTKNVAEAADTFRVNTFVMVSTDKAVNPTNVMGATKRFAEMLIQNLNRTSGTRFVAVRFGNVLGSRGSVIPIFKQQIQNGGPVTVTHPDMTRYFMTIPEASRLVIQAGALAQGGEIFVLDMGDPVKIVDLAKNLITLSGYDIDEIGIEFTGIRPGEKLYEELLNQDEIHAEQIFPKIHVGKAMIVDQDILNRFLYDFPNMPHAHIKDELMHIVFMKQEKKAVFS